MGSERFWAYFKVELREFPVDEDVAVLERTKPEDFSPST